MRVRAGAMLVGQPGARVTVLSPPELEGQTATIASLGYRASCAHVTLDGPDETPAQLAAGTYRLVPKIPAAPGATAPAARPGSAARRGGKTCITP